jgi:hypothetical protein
VTVNFDYLDYIAMEIVKEYYRVVTKLCCAQRLHIN